MRLTERDLNIIRAVARYRFLSSSHIFQLDGGSAQQMLRRLRHLYDNEFLDRPRSQISLLVKYGSAPMAHMLDRKGARLLADCDGLVLNKRDWTAKNKSAGELFISHTLLVADIIVPLEIACRDKKNPDLLDHKQLVPTFPAKTKNSRKPFYWRTERVVDRGKKYDIGQYPDRIFSLIFTNDTRFNFLLEADNGTMSVDARSLNKSSIRRKVASYYAGWERGLHKKLWNFERMRVLFVAPSKIRVDNMIATTREVTGGRVPGLFLFTDRDTLNSEGVFAPIWKTVTNEKLALF